MKEQYITKEGLEGLKKKLDYLKKDKIKEIAGLIKHTASFGDLKENAAYHDAKDKQAFLQGEIKELEERINNAKVIEKKSSGIIDIGSTVTLLLDGDEESVEIVSPVQTDSFNGKISYESPLGKQILNKSVNEEFEVNINGNNLKCKILKVE